MLFIPINAEKGCLKRASLAFNSSKLTIEHFRVICKFFDDTKIGLEVNIFSLVFNKLLFDRDGHELGRVALQSC